MKTKNLILAAVFAALMAVGARLSFNIGAVPFTMQFFFCALAGLLLGPRLGAVSMSVYAVLGLVGAPVFSKGGGIGYVFEPSFGFVLGFVLCAFTVGALARRTKGRGFAGMVLSCLTGLAVLYAVGVAYMYPVYTLYLGAPGSFWPAVCGSAAVCIVGDFVCAMVCACFGVRLAPVVRKYL